MMAATATANDFLRESRPTFERLARSAPPRSSRLQETTALAEKAVVYIEAHWANFKQEDRDFLAALAYTILDPPEVKLVDRFRFASLIIRDGPQAIAAYVDAVQRLRDAILAAIERSDPRYEAALKHELETDGGEAMTQGEASEWLDRVFDQGR
jgi:hypothetical protein